MYSVCRICLDGNTSLQSVNNNLLRRIYKKLTNAQFDLDDTRSRALCCFCYQKLLKCHTFSQMAVRSEKILSALYDRGLEVTHDHISVTRDKKQHLSVSAVKAVHIDGDDVASQVTVKDEPTPSMVTQENGTCEPDELHEAEIYPVFCKKSELTFEDASDRENVTEELVSYTHIDQSKPDGSTLTINEDLLHDNEEVITKLDKLVEVPPPELSIKIQGKKKFSCHLCPKRFVSKSNLVRHMRTHTEEKPFTCNVCKKQFYLKSYLADHIIRTHTVEKPFVCDVCDQKFNRNEHLVSHKKIHTGEKPFPCNVCDTKFRRKEHLDSHRRIHTGERPFPCNVCHKKFKRKDHLEYHTRTHTDEIFSCNVCDKQFTQKNHLASHTRTHIGKQCNVCGKRFSQKNFLSSHMRSHTGKKPAGKKRHPKPATIQPKSTND